MFFMKKLHSYLYLLHIYILYCSNSISLWFCYSILTLYPKITSKYRIEKNNFLILASRLRWIQYSKNTLPSHRLVYCLRLTLADCDRDERQIGTYLNKRRRTTTCHDRAAWKLWRYVPALRHLYFEWPAHLEGMESGPERDNICTIDRDTMMYCGRRRK